MGNKRTETKGKDRIGKKRMMKCGLECTIVAYRSANDIDVLFETGELICNKRYGHFISGSISNKGDKPVNYKKTEADRQKRLGEKKTMNCGLEAEIAEYFGANNITVKMSDGCVVKNRTYQQFLQGGICCEHADNQWHNHQLLEECKEKYVGQTLKMKCGLKATIKEYVDSTNTVIEFENGTVVKNVAIENFKRREVLPYNRNRSEGYNAIKEIDKFVPLEPKKTKKVDNKKKKVSKTIKKEKDKSVDPKKKNEKTKVSVKKKQQDVLVSTGTKTSKKKISEIRKKDIEIGFKRKMLDGHLCEVIKINENGTIDIRYEDGLILKGKSYKSMKNGTIHKPINRVGETNVMNNGQVAKLIKYNQWRDVDIEYEDGTIVCGIEYKHFKDGSAINPNYKIHTVTSMQEFAMLYYLRNYGFTKIKSGAWKDTELGNYELDFYNEEKKIAIEYDGGFHDKADTIERDNIKNSKCKKMGIVLYRFRSPRLKNTCDDNSINYVLDKKKRLKNDIIDCKLELEEILTKHGIELKADDIDFKRDIDLIIDEYRSTHINKHTKERLGETVYNQREEQLMEIIEYFDCKHMTVRFESGEVVHNVQYKQFHRGTLLKPKRK